MPHARPSVNLHGFCKYLSHVRVGLPVPAFVSRQLQAAHNILLLTLIKAATSFGKRSMLYLPIIMEAINRHGLLMLLIANLLTGLANLIISTLEARGPWAFLVVFTYISVLGAAALMLDQVRHMLVGRIEKRKMKQK